MSSIVTFFQNFNFTQLIVLLISAVISLFCITIHELSHGYVAYRLGDPTAKNAGRLTLNPIKHLDLLGFLMMITVHIGWAKPVPVDMRYFKHPKTGMAITALAGPASNLLTALVAVTCASAVYHLAGSSTASAYIILILCYIAVLSVGLGVFNLIPIPPLDGAKILFSFFPDRIYYAVLKYERYIMILMLILAWTGVFSKPINFVMGGVLNGMCTITAFPYEIFQYYML